MSDFAYRWVKFEKYSKPVKGPKWWSPWDRFEHPTWKSFHEEGARLSKDYGPNARIVAAHYYGGHNPFYWMLVETPSRRETIESILAEEDTHL